MLLLPRMVSVAMRIINKVSFIDGRFQPKLSFVRMASYEVCSFFPNVKPEFSSNSKCESKILDPKNREISKNELFLMRFGEPCNQ